MIEVHVDERPEPLAARLAEVLARPAADPFAPDWLVVPSERMRRWLHLELARHLGAAPGRTDGVLANVHPAFPGSLRSAVLAAGDGDGDEPDPWDVERLAWALLEVADAHPGEACTAVLRPPAAGGSRYGRARRIADLFDRYHLQRPQMIFAWRNDRPVDGLERQIAEHHRWQPDLWRLVREHLGRPSPPERLPRLLAQVSRGDLALDLPPRLVVFGLTVLPGGAGFLDVVQAVGAGGHHELHLLLLEPSAALGARLARGGEPEVTPLRAEDQTVDLVRHPLLASWGRLSRETATLLGRSPLDVARPAGSATAWDAAEDPVQGDLFADSASATLLARLQEDLRADRPPIGHLVPSPDDRSVQLHECFGPTRQVEALRDAVLHLLADPTLALSEDDVVVGCPDLDLFTPLIESVLGPSAKAAGGHVPPSPDEPERAPSLRYGIAQRSLRSSNPTVAALFAVLDLLPGRFEAPAVLDLLSMPPVRLGARLSEDDLAQVGEWVEEANVRWGLDAAHRAEHGFPGGDDANTWRQVLDRLLVGVAVADDAPVLAVGDVTPLGAEGDAALLAGRLAELLWQLDRLASAAEGERTLDAWLTWLDDVIATLFAAARDDAWQLERLHQVLGELREVAVVGGTPAGTVLQLADLKRLLAERLDHDRDRPVHFRGGITFCELPILRWVPAKVVCLLGMDEGALSVGGHDGDDLVLASARFGDADRRGDARQALLETVLAAQERLLVFRDGRDLHTNQDVPTPIPIAELQDALLATVHPDHVASLRSRLVVRHPRQPYDQRCFEHGGVDGDGPWSFDPVALAGARAQADGSTDEQPFLPAPLPDRAVETIELDALRRFLKQPVKAFFDRRLEVRFPDHDDPISARLPVDLVTLSRWKVADRLLRTLLEGGTSDEWLRIERQRGTLPPGALGDQAVQELVLQVGLIADAAVALGLERGAPQPLPVDVTLADGTRVVGTVERRLASPTPGPAFVTFSNTKPAHRLQAWLELVALAATEPITPWRSLVVSKNRRWKPDKHADGGDTPAFEVCDLEPVDGPAAFRGLEVVVDCYRRGMTEPLPFFPKLSWELFEDGRVGAQTWNSGAASPVPGEGDDEASRLAFPFGVDDLLALPARPDDPPGPQPGRAGRYAHLLWSTVLATAHDRAAEGDEEGAA